MTTKAKKQGEGNIKVFENLNEISAFAANKFIEIGNEKIKENGRFTVALAGGSTPKSLYELLTTNEFRNKIDWEKVYFFFGDERDVSPMSEMSNFRMANEIMLKNLDVPQTNIFRWHTEIINAPEVAESYERSIKKFFALANGEFPRFDLILLGMGDDGHTASLFPFTDALNETTKIVVANYVEKLDSKRLTFTYPTINNAKNIIFLVGGANKADALREILEGVENTDKFPSQNVNPENGKLIWLVDKKATQNLSN